MLNYLKKRFGKPDAKCTAYNPRQLKEEIEQKVWDDLDHACENNISMLSIKLNERFGCVDVSSYKGFRRLVNLTSEKTKEYIHYLAGVAYEEATPLEIKNFSNVIRTDNNTIVYHGSVTIDPKHADFAEWLTIEIRYAEKNI